MVFCLSETEFEIVTCDPIIYKIIISHTYCITVAKTLWISAQRCGNACTNCTTMSDLVPFHPGDHKTFFKLNSTEHELSATHKK